ncbi:MarR family transcriptional regulator [Nocardia sp. bgisy134]|uniref:MarR family transcriptional regulator n=1 Tax=unclassified Nocardia TaxID=2637762 RepID=UPI003D73239C
MEMNEGRVMAALHDHGPLTTAELARETRMKESSVRSVVRELVDRSLVETAARGWTLSARGQAFTNTPRGRNALDVPTMPRRS